MGRVGADAPLTIEERREQYQWAMMVLRLGQSGNREGLHAELQRQEDAVIALFPVEQGRGAA